MDGTRFDELSRRFATRQTRRSVLGMLGAVTAGVLASETVSAAPKQEKPPKEKPKKCYGEGSHCTNGKQCCSNTCTNRQCAAEDGPECAIAADCAGADSECQTRTCIDGTCGVTYTQYGVAVSDQIAGDCQSNVCNGSGGVVATADDADVPLAANDCISTSCADGVASISYLPAETSCQTNGGQICDGAGQCVACLPGTTQSCYSGPVGTQGVGICRAGTKTCRADGSGFDGCVGEVTPRAETCNGLDDDCDGFTDEGVAGVGSACATGLPGVCAQGTLHCQNGGLRCVPSVQPFTRSETCNGLDDDCDGIVDEGACPFPMECRSGDNGYGCCFPSGVSAGNCDQCCSGECLPLLNVCT